MVQEYIYNTTFYIPNGLVRKADQNTLRFLIAHTCLLSSFRFSDVFLNLDPMFSHFLLFPYISIHACVYIHINGQGFEGLGGRLWPGPQEFHPLGPLRSARDPPRPPHEPLIGFQERPMAPQDWPRVAQERPKSGQGRPTIASRAARSTSSTSKSAPQNTTGPLRHHDRPK